MNPSDILADIERRTDFKRQAAEQAVSYVESGMVIGLGVGSTAVFAVRRIAQLRCEGKLKNIVGVPCSLQVEAEARQLDIPITNLGAHPIVDITIDGADEVAPDFSLIKGGGGALLREKIVAQASCREIIVVDEKKLSPLLGTHWAVPVEVLPFGWQTQSRYLSSLNARVVLRQDNSGSPFITDQGNFILDCDFGPIEHPAKLALKIKESAGIIEHGLFLGLATDIIVAGVEGIRHMRRRD